MEYLKVFIILQLLFLIFQFIYIFKLETYQYCELVFGSVLIIIFFGFIASITLNLNQKNQLNKSALLGLLFAIWFYSTKKITNFINSDKNGVIYF